MGFRSTFVTQDRVVHWPDWFRQKWQGCVHFPKDEQGGPLSAKIEFKHSREIEEDIQKAIDWKDFGLGSSYDRHFVLVWLHECGGITRVEIWHDLIFYNEPDEWENTDDVTHSYCDGCSNVDRPELVLICCDHCREWFQRRLMKGGLCPTCRELPPR